MFSSGSSKTRRLILSLVVLAIVSTSVFFAWVSAGSSAENIRSQLITRATTVAYLLDQPSIQSLSGTEADEQSAAYQQLKTTLAHIKSLRSDVRSMYITIRHDDKLYFYVDSEQPDSPYYSPPGDYYPDATPLFKGLFDSGQAAAEGPSKDTYGTWVSGLAPVINSKTHQVIAVLGIDIDAGDYYRSMISAASIPLLIGLLILGTIFAYEWLRIRDQKTLQLRSELVSIASHELRTPLTGILWTTENLRPKLHEEGTRKLADEIYTNTISLQAGIEDILQLSRLNSHKKKDFELKENDFTKLLKEVYETQHLYAIQKTVAIIIDGSWHQPTMIRCDANTMKRALNNVVSNAVKYSKSGTKVVIHYDHDDKTHKISIQDHGIGIPLAERAAVMTGFYRATNAKASGVEGTGMGLYLTKNVLQQHHGELNINSEEGKGTIVTLLLPK